MLKPLVLEDLAKVGLEAVVLLAPEVLVKSRVLALEAGSVIAQRPQTLPEWDRKMEIAEALQDQILIGEA